MTACLCCATRDPGHRYACTHCVTRIRGWLDDIEHYACYITAWSLHPTRQPGTGSRGGTYTSRPPANLDAIVTLDPRSHIAEHHDPVIDDPDPLWSIPASIHALTQLAAHITGHQPPARALLVPELRWLRTVVDALTLDRRITTIHEGLHDLHTQARTIARDQPPKPLGDCLELDCDGIVLEPRITRDDIDPDPARCTSCRREYAGLDLLRLRSEAS